MVKRLIDDDTLENTERRLADLFRSAVPFQVDPFRKRRILVRLERGGASSARPFWLRPAIIATLLVSGTAAAALGQHYRPLSGLLGSSAAPVAPSLDVATAARHASLSHTGSGNATATSDTSDTSDTSEAAEPAAPEPSDATQGPARAVKNSARVRLDSGEDPSHVVEAIQALRTERDPARAEGLLNDYLKAHPHGVLSGDALALSIEAASAQHDPRAADYARRYLASFPKGKYRELAKRALEKQR
jgi:hypothetical protein